MVKARGLLIGLTVVLGAIVTGPSAAQAANAGAAESRQLERPPSRHLSEPSEPASGYDSSTCLTPATFSAPAAPALPGTAVRALPATAAPVGEPGPTLPLLGNALPDDLPDWLLKQQPAPRQYAEDCPPTTTDHDYGAPLWEGPDWGVPSLGGFI